VDEVMNFYLKAPKWNSTICPDLSNSASETNEAKVNGQKVIQVFNATYRRAVVNGYFLLAPSVKLPLGKVGYKRVEVHCCWFGHKLPSERGIKLLVHMGSAKVIENYNGNVVSNIST
jgi:hypothetical protein